MMIEKCGICVAVHVHVNVIVLLMPSSGQYAVEVLNVIDAYLALAFCD